MARNSWLVAAALLVACGSRREDPDQVIAVRIPRECAALSTCSALEQEALDRVNDCKARRGDCRRPLANLENVRSRIRELDEPVSPGPTLRPPALPPAREEPATAQAPAQEAGAPASPDEPSERTRGYMLEQMSERGPEGRETTVRDCLYRRGFKRCGLILELAIEAAATPSEAEKLRRLGERAAAAK